MTFSIDPKSVTVGGQRKVLDGWQMDIIRASYEDLFGNGNWPSSVQLAEFQNLVNLMVRLDSTWRIASRGVPEGLDEYIDGQDCYVFMRKGGERPTDQYSYTYQPVSSFWGQGKPE